MDNLQRLESNPDRSYRIIAFGSSNTESTWSSNGRHNWVEWLNMNVRHHIGRHVCVINQGIGGETTNNLLERMDRDVLSFQPSAVIITIGGNDAIQSLPLERYADNLRRICTRSRHGDAEPILQTYYCPMYHQRADGFKSVFESYMEVIRTIAREMGVLLVDQYDRFEPFYRKQPEQYAKLMLDSMHVNHLGNLIMGMHISRAFQLPELQLPQDIMQETLQLKEQMDFCCN
ncbi:SGNH/GDSL hydrolase family protein [Cohnella sp. GbtcB17]|uniref:SGNH/GDSL hydrolase family protein n=1 Tax=Cohnella sp. GbtcB17 TaxID=2824762 RepID=UPI001C304178|nr:SGNH/GDSL hydrolase family protein [Cohnella sp. GbtcB17]